MSAGYVALRGYGGHHEHVYKGELDAVLGRVDAYAGAFERHTQDGNRALLSKLDQLLAELATQR